MKPNFFIFEVFREKKEKKEHKIMYYDTGTLPSEKFVFWIKKWSYVVYSQESYEKWFDYWTRKLGSANEVGRIFGPIQIAYGSPYFV